MSERELGALRLENEQLRLENKRLRAAANKAKDRFEAIREYVAKTFKNSNVPPCKENAEVLAELIKALAPAN